MTLFNVLAALAAALVSLVLVAGFVVALVWLVRKVCFPEDPQ